MCYPTCLVKQTAREGFSYPGCNACSTDRQKEGKKAERMHVLMMLWCARTGSTKQQSDKPSRGEFLTANELTPHRCCISWHRQVHVHEDPPTTACTLFITTRCSTRLDASRDASHAHVCTSSLPRHFLKKCFHASRKDNISAFLRTDDAQNTLLINRATVLGNYEEKRGSARRNKLPNQAENDMFCWIFDGNDKADTVR